MLQPQVMPLEQPSIQAEQPDWSSCPSRRSSQTGAAVHPGGVARLEQLSIQAEQPDWSSCPSRRSSQTGAAVHPGGAARLEQLSIQAEQPELAVLLLTLTRMRQWLGPTDNWTLVLPHPETEEVEPAVDSPQTAVSVMDSYELVARWRKVVHVCTSLLVQIKCCNLNSAFLCLTLLQF